MGSGHDQRAGLLVSRYVRGPLGTRVHICLLLRKDRRHDPINRIPSAPDVGSRNADVLPASDISFLNSGSSRISRRIYPAGLAALLLRLSTRTIRSDGCIPIVVLGSWRHEPRNDCRALHAGRVDPCGLYLANSRLRPKLSVRLVAGVRDNRGLAPTRCASLGLNQFSPTRFASSRMRFYCDVGWPTQPRMGDSERGLRAGGALCSAMARPERLLRAAREASGYLLAVRATHLLLQTYSPAPLPFARLAPKRARPIDDLNRIFDPV